MKILLVSEYSPCEFHGIAIRVRNLAAELTKQGHKVRVFTSRTQDELRKEGYNDEEHLPLFEKMGPCLTNFWNGGNRICYLPGLSLLKAIVGESKPDVMHLFFPTIISYPLLMIGQMRGIATYCSHHVDMNFYMDQYMEMLGEKVAPVKSQTKPIGDFCKLLSHSYYNSMARLPSWLFSDLNVAPTVAAMDKEFLCFTGRVDWLVNSYNRIYPYCHYAIQVLFSIMDRMFGYRFYLSMMTRYFLIAFLNHVLPVASSLGKKYFGQDGAMVTYMSEYKNSKEFESIVELNVNRLNMIVNVASFAVMSLAFLYAQLENYPNKPITIWTAVVYLYIIYSAIIGYLILMMYCDLKIAFDKQKVKNDKKLIPTDVLNVVPTSVADKFTPAYLKDFEKNAPNARTMLGIDNMDNKKLIVMVNRLAKEKNIETAIDAVSKLRDDYHLLIVGDGPWRQELLDFTKEKFDTDNEDLFRLVDPKTGTVAMWDTYNMGEKVFNDEDFDENLREHCHSTTANVTFMGMVPNTQLPNLYLAADFFLSASVSETFGITVIEAIACNLFPVLATCPVFEEMYKASSEVTSQFFNNTDELVQKLSALKEKTFDVGAIRNKLSNGGLYFGWKQAALATANQYQDLINFRKSKQDESEIHVLIKNFWKFYDCSFGLLEKKVAINVVLVLLLAACGGLAFLQFNFSGVTYAIFKYVSFLSALKFAFDCYDIANPEPYVVVKTKQIEKEHRPIPVVMVQALVFHWLLPILGHRSAIFQKALVMVNAHFAKWDIPFESEQEAVEKIESFCKLWSVKTAPWEWDKKEPSQYKTMNEFFGRTYNSEILEERMGLVAEYCKTCVEKDEVVIVSPADCTVTWFNSAADMPLKLKNKTFASLSDIGIPNSEKYENKTCCLCYLAPADYHRFHVPMGGKVTHNQLVDQDRYSVTVKYDVYKYVNILNENRRGIVVFENSQHQNFSVAMVVVGGVTVDSIRLNNSTTAVGSTVKAGQEVGTFARGGSLIALFFSENVALDAGNVKAQMYPGSFDAPFKVDFGEKLGTSSVSKKN